MKKLLFLFCLLKLSAFSQVVIPLKLKNAGSSGINFNLQNKTNPNQPNIVISIPGLPEITNGLIPYSLLQIPFGTTNISAGVYNNGILVRTLLRAEPVANVTTGILWDGKLDDGSPAPLAAYTVEYVTHKVAYNYEGIVGNSSTNQSGPYIHKGDLINDLAFLGSQGFVAGGYSEHRGVQKTFNISNPNLLTNDYIGATTTQSSARVVAYNNIVYWAGYDADNNTSFIYGSYADQQPCNPFGVQVQFTNGSPYTMTIDHVVYSKALGIMQDDGNTITAMDIQKGGKFLFLGRVNKLQVFDISNLSGARVQNLDYADVRGVAADNANNIYLSYNGLIKKLTVNADGSLTPTSTTFTGITNPGALSISPDFNTVLVADNATTQVLRYSVNGGAPIATYLLANAYNNSVTVANDKIYEIGFIRQQPDGSFWVQDFKNRRVQHYDASGNYINQIAYIQSNRIANIDKNNPTRVFSGLNEFQVDYSKPLDNGTNGSWKLVKNWIKTLNSSWDSEYTGFTDVATLSNNHTYGVVDGTLYALEPAGLVSVANVGGNVSFEADGSLYRLDNSGSDFVVYKRTLTGFTGLTPNYSTEVVAYRMPYSDVNSPIYYVNNVHGASTNTNKYFWYNAATAGTQGNDAAMGTRKRMGGQKVGQTSLFFTAMDIPTVGYAGGYPAGAFDMQGGHAENSKIFVAGSNLFVHTSVEFWKSQYQVNRLHHFTDDGLLIGSTGTDGFVSSFIGDNAPGMAGNSFGAAYANLNNDTGIFVNCDESVLSGVQIRTIKNLTSIQKHTIPVTLSVLPNIVPDPADLMAGVPYQSSGFYGGSGWTMNPSRASADGESYWSITTTKNTYLRDDVDIFIQSDGNTGGAYKTVSRTLGSNNINNWNFTGSFKINSNLNDNYNLDLLDASGKILATIRTQYSFFLINGVQYLPGTFNANMLSGVFVDFKVQDINGQVYFSMNGLTPVIISSNDSGGNFNTIASFRVRAGGSGDNNHTLMSVKGLRFTH